MSSFVRPLCIPFVLLLALSLTPFTASGTGYTGEVWFQDSSVVIGGTTAISARPNKTAAHAAWFIISDNTSGSSTVVVGGATITVPYANATVIGTARIVNGIAKMPFGVPANPALVGTELIATAVWFNDGTPIVASAGGPIIIDDLS